MWSMFGKKYLLIGISIIIITIVTINIYVKTFEKVVYPNVYVEDIYIGKLNEEDAIKKIHINFEKKILDKNIIIQVEQEEFKISFKELGIEYDIQKAVKEAINYSKDLNVLKKFITLIKGDKNYINIDLKYNEKAVDGIIYSIESDVNIKPLESEIKIDSNGVIQITEDATGIKLESDILKKDILKEIESKKIEEKSYIVGNLITWYPKKTKEKLKIINRSITEFSTEFMNSGYSRKKNIKLATEAINGKVLMPNETFSFNDVVGPRTASKGYERANVISGNRYIEDIGGGVCQVSTTLYNAVLKSDLEVLERRNHSLRVKYVPLGLDAMVSYGASDLKFKNTTDYPIYIYGEANENYVAFKIYSNNSLAKKHFEIETNIEDIIKPKNFIKYNSNMAKGERYVQKTGKPGYKVNSYKKIYVDGKFIEKKLISKDIYKQVENIVIEGR